MNWRVRQEVALRLLPPHVAAVVREAMTDLEERNVVDAPGVICGVLGRMRQSDSEAVRKAVPRAEEVLKWALAPPLRHKGA